MLEKDGKANFIQSLPRDRLLTETDGPFTKAGSRAAEPVDAGRAIRSLSRLLDMTEADAATMVLANLRTLLSEG